MAITSANKNTNQMAITSPSAIKNKVTDYNTSQNKVTNTKAT